MRYEPFQVTAQMKDNLRQRLESQEEFISVRENPLLGGLITCLGIQQEVGTENDELVRHLFDRRSDKALSADQMRSEIVTWQGQFGVRIWSEQSRDLILKHEYLEPLIHPHFSYEAQRLTQVVVFPQVVAEISALSGVEAMIVKPWALNTIFGAFGSQKMYYVTNEWEVMENDALRMAKLLTGKGIPFMGTHDLSAHVAGVTKEDANFLSQLSRSLIATLESGDQKSFQHLIVPYLIGMALDDLAQPRNFRCSRRLFTVEKLKKLQSWVIQNVRAQKGKHIFPPSFSKIIEESRKIGESEKNLDHLMMRLSGELQLI